PARTGSLGLPATPTWRRGGTARATSGLNRGWLTTASRRRQIKGGKSKGQTPKESLKRSHEAAVSLPDPVVRRDTLACACAAFTLWGGTCKSSKCKPRRRHPGL